MSRTLFSAVSDIRWASRVATRKRNDTNEADYILGSQVWNLVACVKVAADFIAPWEAFILRDVTDGRRRAYGGQEGGAQGDLARVNARVLAFVGTVAALV